MLLGQRIQAAAFIAIGMITSCYAMEKSVTILNKTEHIICIFKELKPVKDSEHLVHIKYFAELPPSKECILNLDFFKNHLCLGTITKEGNVSKTLIVKPPKSLFQRPGVYSLVTIEPDCIIMKYGDTKEHYALLEHKHKPSEK